MFAQVALTFAVLIIMGAARRHSIRARRQRLGDLGPATDTDWEPPAVQAANNFKNQFEMPVLFYAVTAFALMTRQVDPLLFGLACLFVLTRIVHTVIHVGANQIKARAIVFFAGAVVLIAMWITLGWRLAAAGF